jgi:hypothetical protein
MRLMVGNGVLLAIGLLLIVFGWRVVATWFFVVTAMNVAQMLYHHWRPPQPKERRGWYLDPKGSGKWVWWNGSDWVERPPD